jgi:hypothetical protein
MLEMKCRSRRVKFVKSIWYMCVEQGEEVGEILRTTIILTILLLEKITTWPQHSC